MIEHMLHTSEAGVVDVEGQVAATLLAAVSWAHGVAPLLRKFTIVTITIAAPTLVTKLHASVLVT